MAHRRSRAHRLFCARIRFQGDWLWAKRRGLLAPSVFLERPEFDERRWLATRHTVKDGYHGWLEGTGRIEVTSEQTGITIVVQRDKGAEDELRGRPPPRPFIAQPAPPRHVARPFVAHALQAVG